MTDALHMSLENRDRSIFLAQSVEKIILSRTNGVIFSNQNLSSS